MTLEFTQHKKLSLKEQPEFGEKWLHDRICESPSILGLGELDVLQRERPQFGGGRLDFLLANGGNDLRFEVEVMLGATDPSHIVRCIEYWDIERRRFPGYDHIAVLIAEEITSRFLNVISLLSGTIPIVAIQLNALQVGSKIVLDFVKVLDQRTLRTDDVGDAGGDEVDRPTWIAKKGEESVKICDRLLDLANQVASPPLELKFKKTRVALATQGSFFNVAVMYPKKLHVIFVIWNELRDEWLAKLEQAGLDVSPGKGNRLIIRLQKSDLDQNQGILKELIQESVKNFQME